MNVDEAKRVVNYLASAAPANSLTAEAVAVYADQFIGIGYAETSRVVRLLVGAPGRKPFLLAPGEILEAVFAARLRVPSVAFAVNEIASKGIGSGSAIETMKFSHDLVREAALEVGAARIADDWSFAHKEVERTYERLRREYLAAAIETSMTGETPPLPDRIAYILRGLDPYERPGPPPLAEGDWFSGWAWDSDAGEWRGTIESAAHRAGLPADDATFPRTREGAALRMAAHSNWRARPDVYVRDVRRAPLYVDAAPRLESGLGTRSAFAAGSTSIGGYLPDVAAAIDAKTTGAEPR